MLNSKLMTPLLLLILFTAFLGSFMQYDVVEKATASRETASISSFVNSCRTALRGFIAPTKNRVKDGKLARLVVRDGRWSWNYVDYTDYHVLGDGTVMANGAYVQPNERYIPPGHYFDVLKGRKGGNMKVIVGGIPANMPISALGPRVEIKLGPNTTYIMYPNGSQSYIFNGKKTKGYKVKLLENGWWQHTKDGKTYVYHSKGNLIEVFQ